MRRYKDTNKAELVFLDHGLYEDLSEDTRLNFALLWRSIMLQEQENVKKYSNALGADFYELFVCILTLTLAMLLNRKWTDLMDPRHKYNFKTRLGAPSTSPHKLIETEEGKNEVRDLSVHFMRDITVVLGSVKREVILLLKIFEVLKSIEMRFHEPVNSYQYFVPRLIIT